MRARLLGRTGLKVSEIGLGGVKFKDKAGGAAHAAVIRRALERGVTLIDTAPGYGDSEETLGAALAGVPRGAYVLSTKYYPYGEGDALNLSGEALARSIARSLSRLKTGHVDLLHLHWVHSADDVLKIMNSDLGRTLKRLQSVGNIRHLAVSEASELDGGHAMLEAALPARFFESVMVTYNVLFQSAEPRVLPLAKETSTGVLVMMPLNQPLTAKGLNSPDGARENVAAMITAGALPDRPPYRDPGVLDFMTAGTGLNLPQAAIRFCLDREEVSSVLVGTASVAHLDEDLAAAEAAPLSSATHARARELFGSVIQQVK